MSSSQGVRCFICDAECDTYDDLSENNMFLLKYVLEIPILTISRFLKTNSAMDKWIQICDFCKEMVEECDQIAKQARQLHKKWKHCQTKVVATIQFADKKSLSKSTETSFEIASENESGNQMSDTCKEIKKFVTQHNYVTSADIFWKDVETISLLTNDKMKTGRTTDSVKSSDTIHEDNGSNSLPENFSQNHSLQSEDSSTEAIATFAKLNTNNQDAEVLLENAKLEGQISTDSYSTEIDSNQQQTSVLLQNDAGESPDAVETITFEVCEKEFSDAKRRKLHQFVHSNEFAHKCYFCKQSFKLADELKSHLQSHTLVFNCKFCQQSFKTCTGYMSHEMKCSKNVCEICHKRFTQARYVDRHVRTFHLGERNFNCGVCGKAFQTKQCVVVHERLRSGEKPYSCGICNKACVTSTSLNVHMRSHVNEKPYKCRICGMSYKHSRCLKNHMKKCNN